MAKEVEVNNPFIVGKYLSDKYFCDRQEETEFLRKQIGNGSILPVPYNLQ
jgi:hypothetical protein